MREAKVVPGAAPPLRGTTKAFLLISIGTALCSLWSCHQAVIYDGPGLRGRGFFETQEFSVITPEAERQARSLLTSLQAVRPLRNESEHARTRECLKKGDAYVHLVHMRKSGGSSLRLYFDKLVQREHHRLVYATEGDAYNVSCMRDQGELLVVTALRHPIKRIESAYWYEGIYDLGPRKGPNARPRTFREWLESVREEEQRRGDHFASRRCWHNVDNYYIKTLTNRYRENPAGPVTAEDFELAKRILASFDLVLITEHMNWDNQTQYMNDMLHQPSWQTLWQRNKNNLQRPREPEDIDKELMDELYEANYWDLLLYEYAMRLVDFRLKMYLYNKARYGSGFPSPREGTVECRTPVNDPYWRFDGEKRPIKPNAGSYLYSRPRCQCTCFKDKLIKDVW